MIQTLLKVKGRYSEYNSEMLTVFSSTDTGFRDIPNLLNTFFNDMGDSSEILNFLMSENFSNISKESIQEFIKAK